MEGLLLGIIPVGHSDRLHRSDWHSDALPLILPYEEIKP